MLATRQVWSFTEATGLAKLCSLNFCMSMPGWGGWALWVWRIAQRPTHPPLEKITPGRTQWCCVPKCNISEHVLHDNSMNKFNYIVKHTCWPQDKCEVSLQVRSDSFQRGPARLSTPFNSSGQVVTHAASSENTWLHLQTHHNIAQAFGGQHPLKENHWCLPR